MITTADAAVRSLSPINSGATAYLTGHRGSATFQTIADYQHPRSQLRPPKYVVELAVAHAVPDIVDHTLRVELLGAQTRMWRL